MRALTLLLTLLLASPAAGATGKPSWATRGVLVTLHVPQAACKVPPQIQLLRRPRITCEAEVRGGTLRLGGHEDWPTLGPSWFLEGAVDKWKWSGRKGEGTLEVQNQSVIVEIHIIAAAEDEALTGLDTVLTYGSRRTNAAVKRRREILSLYAAALMPPDLVPSVEARTGLLEAGYVADWTTSYSLTEYKGGRWLAINLGAGPVIYNELKVSQAQRAATIITQRFLPIVKGSAEPFALATDGLAGLELRCLVGHRDFLNEFAIATYDAIQVYIPRSLAIQFGRDEITSQALIDGSVVLVDNSRTAVVLANAVGD